MTKLPSKQLLDGTKDPETTTGEFRTAMGQIRDYLSGLLGEDSADREAARAALGTVSPDDMRQLRHICGHVSGTGDALQAMFDPPVKQLTHATTVTVRAIGRNETSTPTFKADETSELLIIKGTGMPLENGDINGNGHWIDLRYDETLNKWVLLNPATGIFVSGIPSTQAGGTANAIVGCFNPAIIELKNGLKVSVRATAANTSAEPYFQLEEFEAFPIVKGVRQPLIAGDIAGEGHWLDLQFDSGAGVWILQNPASGVVCPSGVPVGAIAYFAMRTPPAGYLKADGSAVLRASYPQLFAAIGTIFGESDNSSTFKLPDLRGEFIRGYDEGRNADMNRVFGSFQNESFRTHRHFSFNTGVGYPYNYVNANQYPNMGAQNGSTSERYTITGSDVEASVGLTSSVGDNETRPRNIALLACIKAFDAFPFIAQADVMTRSLGETFNTQAYIKPNASKAWVNFNASSGEILIRNACHVEKVIRVEKGVFDIIFDESVQADSCTVTASSSALISAVNLDSFTGEYFPPSVNRVRVVTASGFPIQPVDPADINVVVNQ